MCTVFIHVHWPRITSGRPGSRVVVVWWSSGSPDHHKANNNCIFFSQSACACSRADCLHMQSCGDTPRSDTMLDSDRTHARAFATFSAYFRCNPGHIHINLHINIHIYMYCVRRFHIYICIYVRAQSYWITSPAPHCFLPCGSHTDDVSPLLSDRNFSIASVCGLRNPRSTAIGILLANLTNKLPLSVTYTTFSRSS